MQNKVLQLEAASPEGLGETIAGIAEKGGIKNHFVALSISGPVVLTRQFDLPRLSSRRLKNSLKLEAAELLTLNPEEIELDYQVTEPLKDKVRGVFVAAPKKLLEEYFTRLTQEKFIPISITADILTAIDALLSGIHSGSGSFYLLNFAKDNIIHLSVFNKGHCELLRDISYANIDEARQEILQSLRYACGKSSSKHPDEVYVSGDLSNNEGLISDLEAEVNSKVQLIDLTVSPAPANLAKSYFKINLIRKYALPFLLRNEIFRSLNIIIGISLLLCLITAFKIIKTDKLIEGSEKDLASITKGIDYNYIKSLKEKINSLTNAK